MTETAATTGTSAGSSAERKPADDSGFTEEATQPAAGASDESTVEAPASTEESGTGAESATQADPAGDEPTVASGRSSGTAESTGANMEAEATVETGATVDLGATAEAEAEETVEVGPATGRAAVTDAAEHRGGAQSFGSAGEADPDAYVPNGSGGRTEEARPSFTRPPGMVPPPEHPDEVSGAGDRERGAPVSSPPGSDGWSGGGAGGAYPSVSASAPVSAPPRVTGRIPASGVAFRQAAADTAAATPHTPASEPVRPRPAATPRGPRRARLNLKRVDPWSVMKFSFAVSLVMFVVVIVAASVLYLALDAMGVFTSINTTVGELVQSGTGEGGDSFQITARGVIGTAAVLGALNVLLFTSLATLGSFIYNVCADLVGGVEVTLAERD